MKLIKEFKFNKVIDKGFGQSFEIDKDGFYLLEISARCKNWRQNWGRFFDDDDLTAYLDGGDLSGVAGRRTFEKPKAGWNGNELKNLSQINVFVLRLKAGEHQLIFKPDQRPKLGSLRIYEVSDPSKIEFVPRSPYNQAEDGNHRPWYTFALIDLVLESVSITAKAFSGRQHRFLQSDDDDLQIKIDAKRQLNDTPKSHRYWLWCGRVLKGESRTFEKELNLPSGTHYVELFADRTPILEKVTFNLKGILPIGKVKLYGDIVDVDWAHLRKDPSDESEILGKIYDGDELEIIEERVIGKQIDYRSHIWHKVRYKGKTGFILSSFVEISGQEREVVVDKIKKEAKNQSMNVDACLAIAGCESKYKPFATSKPADLKDKDGRPLAARGIFQLTLDALDQLRDLGFEIEDVFDVEENIIGGVKYIKWLYESYHKGEKNWLEKLAVAYNAGQGFVPPKLPLDYGRIKDEIKRDEAKKLARCVLDNYQRKNWRNILRPMLLLFFLFPAILVYYQLDQNDFFEPTVPYVKSSYDEVLSSNTEDLAVQTFFTRGDYINPLNERFVLDLDYNGSAEVLKVEEQGNEIVDREIFFFQENTEEHTVSRVNKEPFFGNVATLSVWKPYEKGNLKILVVEAISGQSMFMQFFSSEEDKLAPVSIEADGETLYTIGTAGGIYFIEFPTPSKEKMILVTHRDYPSGHCRGWGEIYKFYAGKLVKVWDLDESRDWCREFGG